MEEFHVDDRKKITNKNMFFNFEVSFSQNSKQSTLKFE